MLLCWAIKIFRHRHIAVAASRVLAQPLVDGFQRHFQEPFEQLLQSLGPADPLHDVFGFTQRTRIIQDNVVQFEAKKMVVAITRQLTTNVLVYQRRVVKVIQILFVVWCSQKFVGVCADAAVTKKARVVEDLLRQMNVLEPLTAAQQILGNRSWILFLTLIGRPAVAHPAVFQQQAVIDFLAAHDALLEPLKVWIDSAALNQPLNVPTADENGNNEYGAERRYITGGKLKVTLKAGQEFDAGTSLILAYLRHMRIYLTQMGAKRFSILPRSPMRPGYVRLDKRALASLPTFPNLVQGAARDVHDMINLRSISLHNKPNLPRAKSFETDGKGYSVSFGSGTGDGHADNADSDNDDDIAKCGGIEIDVSQMRTGVVKLTDSVHGLAKRMQNVEVIGVDPGEVCPVVAVTMDMRMQPTERLAERNQPNAVKISSG